jgi:hypothetical protein
MNIRQIIEQQLKDGGFDGIFAAGECACCIGDLCPCDSSSILDCEPGYKVMCTEVGDNCECGRTTPHPTECWTIQKNKAEVAA